jgi:large subunit ribosomal protein L4
MSQNKSADAVKSEVSKPVSCPIKTIAGADAGDASLRGDVFGVEVNKNLVQQTVRWQRAKRRAGTHATITRGEMRGGGKKPWKQKGTGRARAGSIVSSLWVGGAIVFGPQPRDYEFRLSKRTRKVALASALSQKVAENNLLIVDGLEGIDGKTKSFAKIAKELGFENKKVLLIIADGAEKASESALWRSARNVESVKPCAVEGVNVYDVLNSNVIVTNKAGISALEGRFSK